MSPIDGNVGNSWLRRLGDSFARRTGGSPAPVISLAAVGAALLALGCETGGVGDPCIPEDEYRTNFGGYSETEVNVESRSFQCETRVCLVANFRGRTTCPYGQDEGDIASIPEDESVPPDDPRLENICKIPGTDGSDPADRVRSPVPAQVVNRRPDAAVYCSCRCADANGQQDDGSNFCECPDGFVCQPLVEDLGLGNSLLAGSYCIKAETQFTSADAECNRAERDCE